MINNMFTSCFFLFDESRSIDLDTWRSMITKMIGYSIDGYYNLTAAESKFKITAALYILNRRGPLGESRESPMRESFLRNFIGLITMNLTI